MNRSQNASSVLRKGLGLIDAQGRHDANVIVRMPDDQSVFSGHVMTAQAHGGDVPLADPLQQIWDLQDLGGADRLRDISYRQVAGNRFARGLSDIPVGMTGRSSVWRQPACCPGRWPLPHGGTRRPADVRPVACWPQPGSGGGPVCHTRSASRAAAR